MPETQTSSANDGIIAIQNLLTLIHFPQPLAVRSLKAVAAYHSIWVISYAQETVSELCQKYLREERPTNNSIATDFILRVAGNQIPCVKTDNEVATLKWLAQNTCIPVPKILYYDNTSHNPLGDEYMIMTRLAGVDAGSMYANILPDQMGKILEQLASFQLDLFKHPFNRLGGLKIDDLTGEIEAGPPLNEHYFQTQQIEEHWPKGESYATLNPTSSNGYPSYVSWITAHVDCYIHGIEVHKSLSWARTHLPQLKRFLSRIQDPELSKELNDIPFRLAHCDLHFDQFLIDAKTFEVTGVLDWEFASVVPFPLWRRSFLVWLNDEIDWVSERERLYTLWEEKVRTLPGGDAMLAAMQWKSSKQELVWRVCNHLRGIGQVCVYGSDVELRSREWMTDALKAIDELDMDMVATR